jgi:hypothetical protein
MLRVAAVATAGMLALPAAAHADAPPAKTVAGVKITWPATNFGYMPGMSVQVKVKSSHRRTQLSLVRVNAAGRALAAVARKTLRSGTFTVQLPMVNDRTYRLRATIAGRTYWSTVKVGAPLASPAVPAPSACAGFSWAPPEFTVAVTSVTAGDEFSYDVRNPDPRNCITIGEGTGFQHLLGDGTWETVHVPWAASAVGVIVHVGQTLHVQARVPAISPAGTYRLAAWGAVSQPFQVSASHACDTPPSFKVDLDPATVAPGATTSFTVEGPGFNGTAEWQRQDGADWVAVAGGSGSLVHQSAPLPPDAPAGTYRLHVSVHDVPDTIGCEFGGYDVYSDPITLS